MQTVEITAKSIQEATQQAADKLGVSPDRVKVSVLEETKGLFGKSSVRVKAELAEEAAAPAAPAEAPAAPAPAAPKGGRGRKAAPAPAAAPVAAPVEETPAETIAEVQEVMTTTTPKTDGRRGRGKKETAPVAAAPVAEAPSEPEAIEEVVATQEDAEALVGLIRELLDSAHLNVTAKIGSISGKYVNIALDGKDVAFIVGKHGEVLNALQYLVNILASRRFDRGVRATLDGNDYRRRREDALTQMAQKIAEQVKARGEEAVLDALPAFERRIVHKALGEIDGITTYSEGEEPNRRVVIAPAD